MSDTRRNILRIKAALSGSFDRVKPLLKRLHPSDIALILENVSPETRKKIINFLPLEKASEALSEMEEISDAAEILNQLTPLQAAELIEDLDPDDAADLLAELPKADIRKIFDLLPDEEEKKIETLMSYGEETAGGIMNPEILKLISTLTKKQAIREIMTLSEEMEEIYFIYVVDAKDRLQGVVSLKDLLKSKTTDDLGSMIREKVVTVDVDTDQEEAARLMSRYNLPALPVVNSRNELLGRITFDDIMDVIEEERVEDMMKFAGVSEDEEVRANWWDSVKSRIPWLLVNLGTAFTAAMVISRFEEDIRSMAYITMFMPVIAGVAGNGATQTLAVTIRRIATEGLVVKDFFRVVGKEVLVGLFNGLVLGIAASTVAVMLNENPLVGAVVFLAMIGNLFIAGFAGSAVPLMLQRVGVDPAVASSIVITAFTDILGYSLLFGLGAALLL